MDVEGNMMVNVTPKNSDIRKEIAGLILELREMNNEITMRRTPSNRYAIRREIVRCNDEVDGVPRIFRKETEEEYRKRLYNVYNASYQFINKLANNKEYMASAYENFIACLVFDYANKDTAAIVEKLDAIHYFGDFLRVTPGYNPSRWRGLHQKIKVLEMMLEME